jgi:hypothetical protein
MWGCFVFCVLCFVFCVLCFVFCVLCFVFCVLCFVFCVFCFVFCVFRFLLGHVILMAFRRFYYNIRVQEYCDLLPPV